MDANNLDFSDIAPYGDSQFKEAINKIGFRTRIRTRNPLDSA